MTILIIIQDAPYGSERTWNGLRLAMKLQEEHAGNGVRIFLIADGTTCALPGQKTPNGYYNVERMLKSIISRGGQVKA